MPHSIVNAGPTRQPFHPQPQGTPRGVRLDNKGGLKHHLTHCRNMVSSIGTVRGGVGISKGRNAALHQFDRDETRLIGRVITNYRGYQ